MRPRFLVCHAILLMAMVNFGNCLNKTQISLYKDRVKDMFYHAYNNYIEHAYPYDELKPLSCSGFDTWGSYSLTLIDSLDMLLILGNHSEFKRVVNLIENNLNFDKDINVSVFETNIRIIGGLLSAHLLSYKLNDKQINEQNEIQVDSIDENWPCDGPLLRMAIKVANKILPAFNTSTGMPYGTINLLNGVPLDETKETCTAGVGTFIVEFATLSRLTGNSTYEQVALKALNSLWKRRSTLNLVGNHINIDNGQWTAVDCTIGSGVDSYFEYLVKGAVLLNDRNLMEQFRTYYDAINQYMNHGDWYLWANMNTGQKSLPLFSSLDCFFPGALTLIGEFEQAKRTLRNYHSVWRQYGSLPEFYNINTGDVHSNREGYPLRPELIESIWYMYRATSSEEYLQMAVDFLESIEKISRVDCGFATVKDVRTHALENRMESFFIAETLKYLYLIFDEDSFLNGNSRKKLIRNSKGTCPIETGFYVFNTEAHPIDGSALDCCQSLNRQDSFIKESHVNQILNRALNLNTGVHKKVSYGVSFMEDYLKCYEAGNSTQINYECDLHDHFHFHFYSLNDNIHYP